MSPGPCRLKPVIILTAQEFLSPLKILQTLEALTGIQEDGSLELAVADQSTPLGLIAVDPAKTC